MVILNQTVLRRENVRDRVIVNFSNFRRRMSAVAAAGILAGTMAFGVGEAQATIYTWTVNANFADNFGMSGDTGVLTGGFKFDDFGDANPNDGSFFDVNLMLTGTGIFANNIFAPVSVPFSSTSILTVPANSGPGSIVLDAIPSVLGFGFAFNGGNSADIFGVTLFPGVIESETEGLQFVSTAPAVVPVPAALPLFGTGLAIMGFLGWRRKSKAAAA